MKFRSVLFVFTVVTMVTAIGFFPAQNTTSAQDAVTLVVWDTWSRPAEVEMIDILHQEFEDAHPGVTIVKEAYPHTELDATLPLALSEASGPDVAQVNQGYSSMGPIVAAGLLLPLDDYADQYGWWDRYALGLHSRNSFSEDGAQFGVGNLYGISNAAEVVGVFYHRDIFAEYGLEAPQTVEELETAMATLKEAGVIPMVFGSLDGWPAIHLWGAVQHAYTDLETLDKFMFRLEGGTFDVPENVMASEKLQEWIKAGYFVPGYEGLDYDQTAFSFMNQDGAMWVTGSWMAGSIISELGEEAVGFFNFPPAEADRAPLNIGGVNLAYGIRASSDHPDLAAEYIDFMTGPRAAELLLERGFLPAAQVDPAKLTDGTLTADIVNAWVNISSQNGVGHYLDWTLASIDSYIQQLMADRLSPEAFVSAVEEEYQAGQ